MRSLKQIYGFCVLVFAQVLTAAVVLQLPAAGTLSGQGVLAAMGSPPEPRVEVSWDRYYDHASIGDIGRRLERAYPNRCRLSSIGDSYEGRELWLITVTNFDQGEADQKPAMYIDGNIHANEIQGTEVSLYTAWYLCEMADRVPWVDSLLDERVFTSCRQSIPMGARPSCVTPTIRTLRVLAFCHVIRMEMAS